MVEFVEEQTPLSVLYKSGTSFDPSQGRSGLEPAFDNEPGGFFEAAGVAMVRENFLFDALRAAGGRISRSMDNPEYNVEVPDFNPYQYIKDNWSEEEIQRNAFAINDGLFDDVANPMQLQARLEGIWEEVEAIKTMGSSTAGAITGSIGTALFDPTTWVPIAGLAGKASKSVKLWKFLSQTTALTAATEFSLQATQDLRTAEESLLNVGSSAVLGAGIGGLIVARTKGHPLHPDTVDGVFGAAGRDDVATMDADGNLTIVPHGEGPNDVSAARSENILTGQDQVKVRSGGRLKDTFIGRALNSVTPTGRLYNAESSVARKIGFALINGSHIYTQANNARIGTRVSAEDIRDFHATKGWEVMLKGEDLMRGLIKDMGINKVTGAGKISRISDSFNELTMRELYGLVDEALDRKIAAEFGDQGLAKIKATAKNHATNIHETNKHFESELIKQGVVKDVDLFEKLQADRETLRAKRDAEIEQVRSQEAPEGADGVTKSALKKQKSAQVADIRAKYKTDIDSLGSRIDVEASKADPLGEDYGVMQAWDKQAIQNHYEEFKNFLHEVATDTDSDFFKIWLEDAHEGMTKRAFDDLASSDPDRHTEILRDYAGDEFHVQASILENKIIGAEHRLKQAELDAAEALRGFKEVSKETSRADRTLVRKRRDALAKKYQTARAASRRAKQESRAFVESATAARTETLTRQQQHSPTLPDVGAKELNALKKADDAAKGAEFDLEVGAQSSAKADDLVPELTKFAKGDQSVQKAEDAALRNPLEAPEAPKTIETPTLAAQKAKAKEAGQNVNRLIKEENRLARQLEAVDHELAKLEKEFNSLNKLKSDERDFLRLANSERKTTAKTVKGLKRQLNKLRKAPGITEVVEKIALKLSQGQHIPSTGSILDSVAQETGRFKERTLRLNDEMRVKAMADLGDGSGRSFMRRDVPNLLFQGYNQLAGRIALNETFGLKTGREFDAWEVSAKNNKRTVLGSVWNDYEELISKARGTGDVKKANKLAAERQQTIEDLNHMRDRLLGYVDVDNGDFPAFKWLSKKFRQSNVIRFASGFGLTSITDTASIVLRHNIMGMFKDHGSEIMQSMSTVNKTELQSWIYAQEVGLAHVLLARRFGDSDLTQIENYGIGRAGTASHKITGAIDKFGERMSSLSSTLGGLPFWNRFWKTSIGVKMSYQLRDHVLNYSKLSQFDQTRLASLGIGESEVKVLQNHFKKYSKIDENGRLDVDFSKWDPLVERMYKIAIQRDMNRAIVTPGIGDTPVLMSNEFFKTWLQFYTFGFATMNRFITPMIQTAQMGNVVKAGSAFMTALVAGAGVSMGKAAFRGEDVSDMWDEDNLDDTFLDIFDRSGLGAWMSAPISAAMQGFGVASASRYSQNNAWVTLMGGVNANLAADVGILASKLQQGAVGDASLSDVAKQMNKLRPFSFTTGVLEAGMGLGLDDRDFKLIDLID